MLLIKCIASRERLPSTWSICNGTLVVERHCSPVLERSYCVRLKKLMAIRMYCDNYEGTGGNRADTFLELIVLGYG